MTDSPTLDEVDPTDHETLRRHLERFAGPDSVTEDDGTLTARFGPSTSVAVDPDGHVRTRMALHAFDGPATLLSFDHDNGEFEVVSGEETVRYTFRRP